MGVRRIQWALGLLLAAQSLVACQPVQGPGHVFSVKESGAGTPVVVVTACPDGTGGIDRLYLTDVEADGSHPRWTILRMRGTLETPSEIPLGEVPKGFSSDDKPPIFELGRTYEASDFTAQVSFRLDQLDRTLLWDGSEHRTASGMVERCGELLAAAERRDRRLTAFVLFGIPGGFVVLMVLVVLLVLDADRRRDREARAMAIEMPPNPNWPVR